MRATRVTILALTIFAFGVIFGAPLRPAPAAAQGEPQAASYTVYMPVVHRPGAPQSPPPPADDPSLLLLTRDVKTNSAASAVGRDGSLHMAGAAYVPYGQASPAFYATCPAGGSCDTIAGWSVVKFADRVDEVQLKLTPAGKPRMLLLTNEEHYQYASCDSNCTQAAGWSVLDLVDSNYIDVDQFASPQHSFALDPQGRPRFIYYNDNYSDAPRGSYYVYCDEGCTDAANWWRTRISQYTDYDQDKLDYPSLAFTPDGRPRIFSQVFTHMDSADESGLYYITCDVSCDDEASWERVRLFERGQGPDASWDMEVDSAGRPRAVFYQEEMSDGSGDRLYYAACEANCLQAASWKRSPVGAAAGEGAHADIALDSKGRPRIAYHSDQAAALGYAWCDAGCTATAGWKRQDVDPLDGLNEEFEVTTPLLCDPAQWLGGYRMSLSIDANGNPRVAYDVLNAARCLTSDPVTGMPRSRIETLWLAVRWAAFAQP